ncbi:MAG TPA: hypothetical protein VFS67_14420 [Polyangiaceae bacterium]|nr:hypothetical protein [Polyangiaceae bacterium]
MSDLRAAIAAELLTRTRETWALYQRVRNAPAAERNPGVVRALTRWFATGALAVGGLVVVGINVVWHPSAMALYWGMGCCVAGLMVNSSAAESALELDRAARHARRRRGRRHRDPAA